ncbi:MAG TPA: hypothetical protein VFX40_04080 [Gemmatimonadaceae bacterium]|nr:hypothetical protein [Gemmatimonadaceae bacterium]
MDTSVVVGRLIHILAGVFWVGTMMFVTVFLMPAIRETGPDGAKVMAAVARRRFMQVMPVVAILTILSGLHLLGKASNGFQVEYLKSGPGHAYGIGGGLAILAFIIGIAVTRPAMMKAVELAQAAASAPEDERAVILAKAQALRARGARAGTIVAWLLVLATVAMAVGRYV